MNDIPDIDIDVADHDAAVAALPGAVSACQLTNRVIRPHISGVYLQKMPVNPLNNLAVFPYQHAEKELGFIKLDLLTNHVYKNITSQDELRRLMAEPIDWGWFKNADFVANLFQFGGWADMVVNYEPQSIIDLACLLAIIRPAKTYLIGQPWEVIREKIWIKETPPEHGEEKKYFKKSHACAYALVVGVDARQKAKRFFDTVTVISESQSQSASCAPGADTAPPD